MGYERPNIAALHAYVPGEQPTYRQTADGPDSGGVVKLNTNENPYPPSPKVMDAIRSLVPEALRLYPPPDARPFREAAAAIHGLTPEQVFATNGGDELIRVLITVFCDPGNTGGIGMTRPSYSLYPVLAAIQDTPLTEVDRGEDFSLPESLAERWNERGCQLAFIVNPHAPSGRYETTDTLRAIASAFTGVLVIDEAYTDFAPGNALELVRGDTALPNVVLLRSLSKGYGLAGLRFGYGLCSAEIVAALDKARDSYNTDILAQTAAVAAINDQDYARKTWVAVKAERARLTRVLRELGFALSESHTNFLLTTPPQRPPLSNAKGGIAETIYRSLKDAGILIRYFNTPGLNDRLRITVGTPEQNTRLLSLIQQFLSG